MADSLPRQTITGQWQAVSTLLPSLTTGTAISISHLGGAIVDIAISAAQPTTDVGEQMKTGGFLGVRAGENDVWLRVANGVDLTAKVSIQSN